MCGPGVMSPAANTCSTVVLPSPSTATQPSSVIWQPKRLARSLCWTLRTVQNMTSQATYVPSSSCTPRSTPPLPSRAVGVPRKISTPADPALALRLVPVARRAREHRAAVVLVEVFDIRQLVDDSGCQDQPQGVRVPAVVEAQSEAARTTRVGGDVQHVRRTDARDFRVRQHVGQRALDQVIRRSVVHPQVAVRPGRTPVALPAGVDEQDAPAI